MDDLVPFEPRTRRPRPWIPHLVWAVLIIGTASVLIVSSWLTKPGKDDCEGIGWGCNLYGGDAALLVAIFVIPASVFLLLIGHTAIAIVSWYRNRETEGFGRR